MKLMPVKANKTPNKILFSGIFLKKMAKKRGTNMTVRLTRKPALEAVVDFIPKVMEANTKNKIDPNKNAYLMVL